MKKTRGGKVKPTRPWPPPPAQDEIRVTPSATSKVFTNRADWLEQRRRGIGSSDAAAIMGLSKWGSPLSVFVDKMGLGDTELEPPEWMRWGHLLETEVAKEFSKRTGRKLHNPGEFTIFQHDLDKYKQVTPDRLIIGGPGPEGADFDASKKAGSLSIKTAGVFQAHDWDVEPPMQYQIQMQHELATLGLEWGSYAVLVGGQKLHIVDVERNDTFCDVLAAAELEFWEKVQSEDPPEADSSQSSAKALQTIFPKSTGASIALPANPYFELADDLDIAKARRAESEAVIRGIENKVKRKLGKALVGVLPDGSSFTWKEQTSKGFTVDEKSFRVLRRKR